MMCAASVARRYSDICAALVLHCQMIVMRHLSMLGLAERLSRRVVVRAFETQQQSFPLTMISCLLLLGAIFFTSWCYFKCIYVLEDRGDLFDRIATTLNKQAKRSERKPRPPMAGAFFGA